MRATLCFAMVIGSLVLVSSQDITVTDPEPPEFGTYRTNIESMFNADMEGTVGKMLSDALNGWAYTLPLEHVRKGQAYVGPSVRLRRVLNDLREGERTGLACRAGCCSSSSNQ